MKKYFVIGMDFVSRAGVRYNVTCAMYLLIMSHEPMIGGDKLEQGICLWYYSKAECRRLLGKHAVKKLFSFSFLMAK